MVGEERLIDTAEYKAFLQRYIKELHEVDAPMVAGAVERCLYKLEAQPTVDAVEVVHGRWEEDEAEAGDPYDGNSVYCFDVMRCSVCSECFDVSVAYNYCPNCGAKMDGDGNA